MTDLLTTKQVQTLLRVDRTTIYRMVESGRLPAIRVGKQWRFARQEIEQWLRPRPAAAPNAPPELDARTGVDVGSLLPVTCVQLIQDLFAEMSGVMVVVTDMQGRPVTEISNPCGFFAALTSGSSGAVQHCMRTWQQLAGGPSLEPRWSTSEMGLLCARGLIRSGSELVGMVAIGGVAPDAWPPSDAQLDEVARLFGLSGAEVAADAEAVHRLDRASQERALRSVQRIADILSHMAEARGLAGRPGEQDSPGQLPGSGRLREPAPAEGT